MIMKGMRALVMALTALFVCSGAAYANADYSIDITFGSGGNTETLQATLIVDNGEVIGMTGSLDGLGFTGANSDLNGSQSITSLLANTNFPGQTSIRIDGGTDLIFDNVFSSGALDSNGIVFELSNGKYINIWENSPGNFTIFVDNYDFQANANGNFVVPEPSSLAMLFAGLLAFGGVFLFGRRKPRESLATV